MGRRKNRKKKTKGQQSQNRPRLRKRATWPWIVGVGGLCALITALSTNVRTIEHTGRPSISYTQEKISFKQFKADPDRYAQTYLDQLFQRRQQINGDYKAIGRLEYVPFLGRDGTSYNFTEEEKNMYLPAARTINHGEGIPPTVQISKLLINLCQTEDELYSALDNETFSCLMISDSKNVKIYGPEVDQLNLDRLSKEASGLIHEALSSKYQFQFIRNGKRQVGKLFRKKMEDTYTVLKCKLIQLGQNDPSQYEITKKWADIFDDAPYNPEIIKEIGIKVNPPSGN